MDNAIYAYYQGIKNGEIVVGMWIRLIYEYIVKGLESKSFFFSAKKANRAISFVENFCHHSKGRNDLIKLELWQKAALSCIFGIVDEMGVRIFREVVIIIGRKNGKSLLAAAIIAYCLYMDEEYGAEIYCAAPKLDQADMVYRAFEQIVAAEDELQEITRRRKADMYVEDSNSNVKKIAFNAKKSDGFNPHLVVCDEIASWPGDQGLKQYEVLKSGMGSRKQPIMLSISTSGYVNEGIFDELIKRCTRFLLGDSKERRIMPLLYMIDELEKWNDINELRKSNPNLGVSVSIDYLLEEIAVAEGSLSKKAEFITKYCNLKQSSSLAWLPSKVVEEARGSMPALADFSGCYCVGGIDLSQTTDLTACTAVIEKGEKLYVFTQFFMPREKVEEATARDGLPYRKYIQMGILTESGENMVDYEDCYRWFVELVEKYRIYPLKVGYDRYSALELVKRMEAYGFHMDSVYQGENLTGVINLTEGTAKDGKFAIGENDLMAVHMLNSAIKLNAETGRKRLIKLRATDRIDGMASLLDAMCMRQNYNEELGEQLRNKRAA